MDPVDPAPVQQAPVQQGPVDPAVDPAVSSGPTRPWWSGAAALIALVVLAVVVVVLVVPGARGQARLSLTERPEPYVELSLLDLDAQRACPHTKSRALVGFRVQRHDVPGPLVWLVRVTPTEGGNKAVLTTRGTIPAGSGADPRDGTASVRRLVDVPIHRSYDLAVSLVGRSERLLLHCPAPEPR